MGIWCVLFIILIVAIPTIIIYSSVQFRKNSKNTPKGYRYY